MIKVSVIIPVYNVENYLRQCLDSVVNQTLEGIEIICVDDGSTDSSPDILEEYASNDSRIKILHQRNRFAGIARNTGLSQANGEYVIFWDSDDYFKLDALEKMYTYAKEKEADICVCDAQDFDDETGKKLSHPYLKKPFPEEEVFNIETYKERIFTFTAPVPWNKLILRELLVKEQIKFPDLKCVEDAVAMVTAIACAKRIVLYHERLIFYRVNRKDSLMNNYGERKDSVFLAYEQLKGELDKRGFLQDPEVLRSFQNKVFVIYLYMMKYCNRFEQYQEYYNELVDIRLKNIGIENLPDDYWYTLPYQERYKHIKSCDAKEYLYWQFRQFDKSIIELRQKVADEKTKNKKLKKTDNSDKEEIKRLQDEIKRQQNEIKKQREIIVEKDNQIQKCEKEILDIKNSWALKIGKAVVWAPKKLKKRRQHDK